MDFDLTHVRHDAMHCLAPGLFRSLKRGERKKMKLDITYHYGEEKIEFSGPEPLGADDLRILQGLIALGGYKGVILSPEPKLEVAQQVRSLLETRWDANKADGLVVIGSYRALAKEVGYADIDNSRPIRECIERLWKVSVIVQSGKRRMGFRLLSEYASDESVGKLFVALNPRITEAILGKRPHIRIDMNEVRALKSDPARLVHQRLCGWINSGRSGKAEIDTLCNYVWPEPSNNQKTIDKRRFTLRKALAELIGLGWTVEEYARCKFKITRPGKRASKG